MDLLELACLCIFGEPIQFSWGLKNGALEEVDFSGTGMERIWQYSPVQEWIVMWDPAQVLYSSVRELSVSLIDVGLMVEDELVVAVLD